MTETTEISTIQDRDAELMNTLCDPGKIEIIKNMFAKNCTNDEFAVFLELSKRYKLDPFSKQIWAIKYNGNAAQIFTGRDGFLSIAHRSGLFDGMESGVDVDKNGETIGWAKVYRKDMSHPFIITVSLKEYDTGKSLWREKPKTMIQKVAESQCLRRAFSISGLYDPDEIGENPDAIQEYSAATTAAEIHGTTTPGTQSPKEPAQPQAAPPASAPGRCKCGQPVMAEELRERFAENFAGVWGYTMPEDICEDCARKLWDEMMQNKKTA